MKSLIPQTATIGLLDILQNTSDHREEFYMNAQCKTNDVIKWIQRLRALSKVARQVSEAVSGDVKVGGLKAFLGAYEVV